MRIPIFREFLATSYLKAFILDAIVVALISIVATTLHTSLSHSEGALYQFFYRLFYGDDKSHVLSFRLKLQINFYNNIYFCILCFDFFIYPCWFWWGNDYP